MKMEVLPTSLPGVFRVVPPPLADERGSFVKLFHRETFAAHGLRTDFAEEYYTVSRARVLRGMHFQTPPHDYAKLVSCVEGEVLDAALDLRAGSPTSGRHELFRLSSESPCSLYLPSGVAHGFFVTGARAVMLYGVTALHAPAHDAGVRWDSAAIPWPDPDPVLSPRDRGFPRLADYATPFTFGEGR